MKKVNKILITIFALLLLATTQPVYADTNLPFQVISKEDSYRKNHSIVQVTNTFSVKTVDSNDPAKRDYYQAKGSGFFISKDLVVTSYHVVNSVKDQASQILSISFGYATTDMFKNYYSELLAYDDVNDIAILKVKRTEPIEISVPLKLASLNTLSTDQKFTMYGYPGEDRRFRVTPSPFTRYAAIQILNFDDSSKAHEIPVVAFSSQIYKGNSGGPLLNEAGEVVTIMGFGDKSIDDHSEFESYGVDPKTFQEFVAPYIQK